MNHQIRCGLMRSRFNRHRGNLIDHESPPSTLKQPVTVFRGTCQSPHLSASINGNSAPQHAPVITFPSINRQQLIDR